MQSIIYIRFSTLEQKKGTSTERQRADCERHALARGWDVESVRIDEGKSAFSGAHREAGSALHKIEAEARAGLHHGKVLLVERLDRLSRQGHEETVALVRSLGECGVSVATVDGDEVYQAGKKLDLIQVITMLVKGETAHEEPVKRAARTKSNWDIRRAKCKATGKADTKLLPPWLTVDDTGKPAAISDRAALIRRMFELADSGHGAFTIAKIFNREKIAPWARFEKRKPVFWGRTFVSRLLRDRRVTGEYQPFETVDGKKVAAGPPWQGHFPAIVDIDLFSRVTGAAQDRLKAKGGGKSAVVANLVSGLARCAECNGSMSYKRNRAAGAPYRTKAGNHSTLKHESAVLQCMSAMNDGPCSNKAQITYFGFERALLDAVLHIALDDKAFARRDEVGRLSIDIAQRERDHELAIEGAKAMWAAYRETQSKMAMTEAHQSEKDADNIVREIEVLKAARDKASGQANAEQHLGRIAEIRHHLYDDDLEVRAVHRKKVAAGFHSVISGIWCEADKTVTIALAGGLAALQIKGGKVVNQANAIRMFPNKDFAATGVNPAMAENVFNRIQETLISNGSMKLNIA